MNLCKICKIRRPRRHCPGVEGDICSLCCGTEREVTVNCPLNCEFLREARLHEIPNDLPEEYPNKDIRITEDFLTTHEGLLTIVSISLANACFEKAELIDFDVREGLEALIKTYRTLESGLIYETKPTNPLAAYISDELQKTIKDFTGRMEAAKIPPLRDEVILGVLAFLQRMEIHHNNGRRKGRSFMSFLADGFGRRYQPEPAVEL